MLAYLDQKRRPAARTSLFARRLRMLLAFLALRGRFTRVGINRTCPHNSIYLKLPASVYEPAASCNRWASKPMAASSREAAAPRPISGRRALSRALTSSAELLTSSGVCMSQIGSFRTGCKKTCLEGEFTSLQKKLKFENGPLTQRARGKNRYKTRYERRARPVKVSTIFALLYLRV